MLKHLGVYIVFLSILLSAGCGAAGTENNPYGVHLLPGSPPESMIWAKSLIGEGGYIKQLFGGLSADTKGPHPGAVAFVRRSYELGMIPICRIATNYNGRYWNKPAADAPGDYTSFAQGVKRWVEGLPRDDRYPLYIEVLNEVNSRVEWSDKPNAEEYAHFQVAVAAAIRSIGDPRIRITNAGMAGGPDFADEMFTAVPESLWAWDVWSTHCYGLNRPPELNKHSGLDTEIAIDAYLDDLAVIEKHGRTRVKVMITETGYQLGERVYDKYPPIDEANRADYIVRSFRDFWTKWPDVLAITPFQFCDGGWRLFDWVYPDSKTDANGLPTRAHKQYYDVWGLAKPNMDRGAVNGKVREATYGTPLAEAVVTLNPGGVKTTTDGMGNYYFPNTENLEFLRPGSGYSVVVEARGFTAQTRSGVAVKAAENTVLDFSLKPAVMGIASGVVRDSATGKPLAGVTVTAEPGGQSAVTNRDGKYIIRGLTPTTYSVTGTKTGYYASTCGGIVVHAGGNSVTSFDLGPGHHASDNLLSNGDMELGGGLAGMPVSWETPDGNPHTQFATDFSERFTGKRSMRIAPDGSQWNTVNQWTNYNSVEAGKRYGVEVWVKTSEGCKITLNPTFRTNATDSVGKIELKAARTTPSGWTLYKGSAEAPQFRTEKTGRIRLDLYVDSRNGTAWFDNIWVGLEP